MLSIVLTKPGPLKYITFKTKIIITTSILFSTCDGVAVSKTLKSEDKSKIRCCPEHTEMSLERIKATLMGIHFKTKQKAHII